MKKINKRLIVIIIIFILVVVVTMLYLNQARSNNLPRITFPGWGQPETVYTWDFDPLEPESELGDTIDIQFSKEDFNKIYGNGFTEAYEIDVTIAKEQTIPLEEGENVEEIIINTLKKNNLYFSDIYLYNWELRSPESLNISTPVLKDKELPDYQESRFYPELPIDKGHYFFGGKQVINGKIVFVGSAADDTIIYETDKNAKTLRVGRGIHVNTTRKINNIKLLPYQKVIEKIMGGYWRPFFLKNSFLQTYPNPQDHHFIDHISLHYMEADKYLIPFYLLCGKSDSISNDKLLKDEFCGIMEAVDYNKFGVK